MTRHFLPLALAVMLAAGMCGCGDNDSKLVAALEDISTNTHGKISVTLETGTWGTKAVFHFEDVDTRYFVTNAVEVEK